MGRDATLEREIKLEAPIALALPDLRPLVGATVRLPEERLVTRYFDTTDRRLWQQGMTLRHRTTGGQEEGVWTLKLPHSSAGRTLERTEVSWPGPNHEFPGDAREVLRGLVRREPIGQLTILETTRQRLVLRDAEDNELAEIDDDVVFVAGGPRRGTRFRQVELEFRDENWKGRRVVHQLEKAGARVERDTKLSKAIDLPRSSAGRAVDEKSTVADVVRASLKAGLDRLLARDWRLRLTTPDPAVEDVHQARVATRRLRSDLKTFGDILDPLWRNHLRQELKWLGAVLGELRDLDVLSDGLSETPVPVRQRLAVQRSEAGGRLAEALASERYLNLVDRLHAGSERLPLASGAQGDAERPAAEVLPSLVAARWRAVRRAVRRAGPAPVAFSAPPDPDQVEAAQVRSRSCDTGHRQGSRADRHRCRARPDGPRRTPRRGRSRGLAPRRMGRRGHGWHLGHGVARRRLRGRPSRRRDAPASERIRGAVDGRLGRASQAEAPSLVVWPLTPRRRDMHNGASAKGDSVSVPPFCPAVSQRSMPALEMRG